MYVCFYIYNIYINMFVCMQYHKAEADIIENGIPYLVSDNRSNNNNNVNDDISDEDDEDDVGDGDFFDAKEGFSIYSKYAAYSRCHYNINVYGY